MKILHMAESFGAGVYFFINEVANYQVLKGNEVTIVYSKRKETPKNFTDDFNPKVKFIYLDMCRSINPLKDIKAFFKFKKIIRAEKPDIIHLHSSKAGFIGRAASKFTGYKNHVFYNPHGFSFLMQDVSNIKRKLYFILEKLASHFGGTIAACSNSEYEIAKTITENCALINNGTDIEKISSIVKSIENEAANNSSIDQNSKPADKATYKIGTIGRICSQKNPVLFNKIAESLPDYKFIWIGDGDLSYTLKSPNITVTGWLNRIDVIRQLLNIDIFIMTSLWEGLPISLLDAMYLRKPCIISGTGSFKKVIVNGENGFIAETDDEFNEYIKLLTDGVLRDKVSQKASTDIINNYNIKRMNRDYLMMYKKALKKNKKNLR